MAVATRELTGAALAAIDTPEFRQALTLAHNAVQWLARVTKSYGASGQDKRGVQLARRGTGVAVRTATIVDRLSLEARLPEFTLQFCVDGQPVPHLIDLDDRTPATVEAWILVELLHQGVDRDRFSKTLPYRIPGLMEGDGRAYDADGCRAGLAHLASWLAFATSTLDALAPKPDRMVMLDPETFECWIDLQDSAVTLPAPGKPECVAFTFGGPRDAPAGFIAGGNGRSVERLGAARIVHDAMDVESAVSVLRAPAASHDNSLGNAHK